MRLYIVLSALYRLSCGALILAVHWLMTLKNDSLSLAILVSLTFLPAIVVPLFYADKQTASGLRLSVYGLFGAFGVSLCLFFAHDQLFIIALNTLLWLFFFLMETSWESWFASLAKNYKAEQVLQFSSISMSLNQVSLMLGPIIAALIFGEQPQKVILVSSLLFLLICLVCLVLSLQEKNRQNDFYKQSSAKEKLSLSSRELALVFVWPTLALFNFVLPLQVAYNGGSMKDASILDAMMGLGMLCSSILLSAKILVQVLVHCRLGILLLLIAAALWGVGESFIFKCLSVFLLGLCFNMTRIVLRSQLAQRYEAAKVGSLVSKANAYSFFLILIALCLLYDKMSINYLAPFVFAIFIFLSPL